MNPLLNPEIGPRQSRKNLGSRKLDESECEGMANNRQSLEMEKGKGKKEIQRGGVQFGCVVQHLLTCLEPFLENDI